MIGIILLFLVAVWGVISILISVGIAKLLLKKKKQAILVVPLAIILFILPLIDEILGSFQFANLCKELPTVEFNEKNNVSGVVYVEDTVTEVKSSFVPIVKESFVFKDVNTKKRIVSSLSYSAKAGWFVKKLGSLNPILFGGSCSNGRESKKGLDSLGVCIESKKRITIDLRSK